MHSPGFHNSLQQVHGICVITRELGHNIVGAPGDGLVGLPALSKRPHLGVCSYNHLPNEPPCGLVEDLSAMG